jgi:uncharacterized membrane protein YhaH (DUF805 family)
MNIIKTLFKGRINRKQFVQYFFVILALNIPLTMFLDWDYYNYNNNPVISFIGLVLWCCLILLYASIAVKRLHDTGRSGKKLFWAIPAFIIPFIWLYLMMLLFQRGHQKSNGYGEPS